MSGHKTVTELSMQAMAINNQSHTGSTLTAPISGCDCSSTALYCRGTWFKSLCNSLSPHWWTWVTLLGTAVATQAGAVHSSPGIAKNDKETECLDLQNPACLELHQSLPPTLPQVAAHFQSQPYSAPPCFEIQIRGLWLGLALQGWYQESWSQL